MTKKALGNFDSPYIDSLLRLIETQSKITLAGWAISYAKAYILPVYESVYRYDNSQRYALDSARGWLDGEIRYIDARRAISEAYSAVTETEGNLAAQSAAIAVNQAALSLHVPAHCLGLAFYGTAALAYARVGTRESHDVYERIASEECGKMEKALREMPVTDEANPAKIDLRIWPQWKLK